jgi:hypothetical protein
MTVIDEKLLLVLAKKMDALMKPYSNKQVDIILATLRSLRQLREAQ